MIVAIFYISFLSILFLISFKKEVYSIYCIVTQKQMDDLFPEFYGWEEGDKILYMANWEDDRAGKLVAMCQDSIVVSNRMGENVELLPHQVKENLTEKKEDKVRKYETFHKDILPAVTSKKESFPELESKNEIMF